MSEDAPEGRGYGRGLATLFRLKPADHLLLIEAFFYLAATSFLIAVLPFKAIARIASRPPKPLPALDENVRRKAARRVRWALNAWGRRVPWRAMCFEKGLAAQAMLSRRGIFSTLYYGAAKEKGRGLLAHVWVKDGNIEVIGCDDLSRYSLLAAFPGNHIVTPQRKNTLDVQDKTS